MLLPSGRADRDVSVWLTFFANWLIRIIYAFARRQGVAACGLSALIVLASIPLQGFSPLLSGNERSAAIDVAIIHDGGGLKDIPPSSVMPASIAGAPSPPGFVSFCMRHPDQCTKEQGAATTVPLTAAYWKRLEKVNRDINWKITAKYDVEHYDRQEYWTIPEDGYGDCEDYALAKLALLLNSGFPHGALRLAIVLTLTGTRHTVLTVTTDHGDYVLDNLHNNVMAWTDLHYRWLLRQSALDPNEWTMLERGAVDPVSHSGAISAP